MARLLSSSEIHKYQKIVPHRVQESSAGTCQIGLADILWLSSLGSWSLPFTLMVEVVAGNLISRPLVANVVKPIIAGAIDTSQMVIRNKEMLLPSHKYEILVVKVVCKAILIKGFQIGLKSWEAFLHWRLLPCSQESSTKAVTYPMSVIKLFLCLPFSSQERVLWPNDFGLKKSLSDI